MLGVTPLVTPVIAVIVTPVIPVSLGINSNSKLCFTSRSTSKCCLLVQKWFHPYASLAYSHYQKWCSLCCLFRQFRQSLSKSDARMAYSNYWPLSIRFRYVGIYHHQLSSMVSTISVYYQFNITPCHYWPDAPTRNWGILSGCTCSYNYDVYNLSKLNFVTYHTRDEYCVKKYNIDISTIAYCLQNWRWYKWYFQSQTQ